MQKIYTHLNNSADKDKKKEIKTPPVPVNDPKRADKIREADKKLFEKLNKIGAAMLIGFLLLTGSYHHDMPVFGALGGNVDPANTPVQHQDQGLGGTFLPVLDTDRSVPKTRAASKSSTSVTKTRRVDDSSTKGKLTKARQGFILAEHRMVNDAATPLAPVLQTVVHNWRNPVNTDVLAVDKFNLEWKNEADFINQLKQKNLDRPLTLITLELQELVESSGKELFSQVPQNKARIKLIMRGIDPQSNQLIFEETIVKEVVQEKWAHYELERSPAATGKPVYDNSLAMQQALTETSTEIITILHKYFP